MISAFDIQNKTEPWGYPQGSFFYRNVTNVHIEFVTHCRDRPPGRSAFKSPFVCDRCSQNVVGILPETVARFGDFVVYPTLA